MADQRVILAARGPEFDLYGELADGGEIPIGAILAHFGIDTPLFESMVLSNLSLISFDGNRSFQVSGRLSAEWHKQIFGMSFAFQSIDLTLQYLAGSFGFSFDCACNFSAVDYQVSGSVDTGGQNLSFSASSRPGQIVALGALFKDILAPFGVALPQLLHAIRLTNIGLTLDGNNGSIDIRGRQVQGDTWSVDVGGKEMQISDMSLAAGVTDAATQAKFYSQLKGWLLVAGEEIEVFCEISEALDFKAYLPAQSLTELLSQFIDVGDVPVPDIDLGATTLVIRSGKDLFFSSSLAMDFHEVAAKLNIPLPQGLARVELSLVELHANPGVGTWSLKMATPTIVSLPSGSPSHLDVSGIEIELKHDTETTAHCQFTLGGTVNVAPEMQIESDGVKCTWQSGTAGKWLSEGTITASIYNKPYQFDVVIDVDGDHSRFGLQYKNALTLVSWAEMKSKVSVDKLIIGIEKAGDDKSYNWSLSGNTHFDIIDKLLVADGALSLKSGSLEITASVSKPPQIALPLPSAPTIDLGLDPLRLVLGADDQKGPTIEAGASVTIGKVPAPIDKVFPDTKMQGTLCVGGEGFSITFMPPGDLALDVTFGAGTPMQVHLPKIAITTFLLDRMGVDDKSHWRLGAKLHVSGLSELNKIFGGADLFEDKVELLLSLGSGLSIVPNTSPIKAVPLRIRPDDKTVWTEWVNILHTGTFSFRVPEFAFDFAGGRWKASGGIETQGDLAIPLDPLKWLLIKCGLPADLLKGMPSSIPLLELDLSSPDFYNQITRMLGQIDSATQKVFEEVAKLLQIGIKRLPDRFEEDYLDLHIPDGFSFDVSVEPTGGFSFAVSILSGKGLRMLIPTVTPPGLTGLMVNSLSFGLSGGGSVGVLKVDGCLDQFDIISLIYALTTGEGNSLSNRFIMHNTTALIPMAAPLPIPLFYDQIGWEYKNVLGLGMQFHASFPDPQPSLVDWVMLLGDMVKFFTDEGYYLHAPDHLPAGMNYGFTLQPTNLSLPSYLGGATLGPDYELPELSVSDTLARALDGIKTGNLGWLIQSVPLKFVSNNETTWIRIGHETIKFGPLEINAGWCITTEEEFKQDIIGDPQAEEIMKAIDVTKTLKHLPKSKAGVAYDKGFIVVIAGGADLAGVLEYTAQFGIAVTSAGGFESRIFMQGGIANVVTLSIDGGIQVERDGTTTIDGSSELKVADTSLLKIEGRIQVTDHSFLIGVKFTLASVLELGGELYIGTDGVYIEGSLAWGYAAGNQITAVKVRANFDAKGMLISLQGQKIFGSDCTVGLYVNAKGMPGALISFDLTGLNDLFINEINKQLDEVKETVKQERNGLEQLIKNNVTKVDNFDQLRRGLPGTLDSVRDKVVSTVKSRADKAWDDLSRFEKIGAGAVGYSKTKVRDKAVGETQNFLKPLETLKNKLVEIENKKIQDEKKRVQETGATIIQALDDSIKLNGKKVPIKFWKITIKNINVKFDTKPLKDLKSLVNQLPDDWTKAEAQRANIANTFASRASEALTDITNNIVKHGTDQAPQIQSIKLDTSLDGLKGPQVTVDVTIKQGSKSKNLEAEVNLANLAKSMSDITKSFVRAIA